MSESSDFGTLTSRSTLLGDCSDAVFLWPVAATEQHGPHLPNSTDSVILEGLRELVEARLAGQIPVVWLPALVFGSSEEHVGFPGTLSLTPRTFMAVVDDVCRSLRAGGGTNVAFVNGHGGNVGALSVMLREVRLRHGLQTCLIRPMSKVGAPSHDGVDMHAGELETSVVMALRPDLVREVSGNGRGGVPPDASGPTIPGSMGWVTSDLSQDGVIGRPQYATTGKGEQLVEHMVTYMVEEIRAFAHAVSQPGAGAPADRHRSAEDGG